MPFGVEKLDMVKVKDAATIQSNYVGSASRAGPAYKSGVLGTSDWQSKAVSETAESNYATKVSAAVAAKSRQKVLSSRSNSDWQTPASTTGATKIVTGIANAGPKYGKDFGPYLATLQAVSLPAKTTDPIANLTNRAGAIVAALVAKKKELKGA